jgi:hypothetical protein
VGKGSERMNDLKLADDELIYLDAKLNNNLDKLPSSFVILNGISLNTKVEKLLRILKKRMDKNNDTK